ncbi:hypothetical protein [Streptomyces albus]|uniref:hypothetical protein n=1 Tax=Streptomyces albus TaxID=1888 RepID=UPI003F1BA51D
MSDDVDDVVSILTAQIERNFGMELSALRAAVAKAPDTNREAAAVVRWHQLLTASQAAVERAEDDLLAALETQPDRVEDPTMELAHRVSAAVTLRDGRAMVLRYLLDPHAWGKQGRAAERRPAPAAGRGPALQTSPPPRPAAGRPTVRGASR